jgi:hypothetical protein
MPQSKSSINEQRVAFTNFVIRKTFVSLWGKRFLQNNENPAVFLFGIMDTAFFFGKELK